MTAAQTPDRRELLKNAFEAIEQLKAKVRSLEAAAAETKAEPIAIVGAACRFPGGANSLDAYWQLLDEGRDVVAQVPPERWPGYGAASDWYAGLIEGHDQFDPRFFGISAREAIALDPQQRLVLEVGWEALEHAGQAPDKLTGSRTGVFVGVSTHDYADLLHETGSFTDIYAATGNAANVVAGRLAFILGLQGPAMSIDTACSSSLVAIHLACQALRNNECTMAVAGGVNALLTPGPFECFRNWGMMAPDGRCKTFDARANGFVRSEGCGLIVLKKLSHAQADGDRILAVVRGTAVNQDGRSSGLTVPNGPAQEAVIRQALQAGNLSPLDVNYVEAHGTGTAIGDPIEAHAIAAVLGPGRAESDPIVIGSAKTNVGHLESAAGTAGLLKVVASLLHGKIPPHLHFGELNPDIDWGDAPVVIPVNGREWRRGPRPRIAGISSFGFSGTNAHIIVEEAPAASPADATSSTANAAERPLHLFTLSARTEGARNDLVARYAESLPQSTDTLADICYSAATGRAQLSYRLAIPAATRDELVEKLRSGKWIEGHVKAGAPRVVFLFTGQGSQYAGMARELYDTEPVFRAALDECAAKLALGKPLLDVLYGAEGALLDETAYTQPALFAVEWALARLWQHWGIRPDAVLGHSVGEYVALTVAGVWSLDDGLRLIAERGRMMQALGGGWGMTSVLGTRAQVETAVRGLEPWVSIAAANAPESLVISGRNEELRTCEERLQAAGCKVKSLTVSHAFHSAQMDGMAAQFAQLAQSATMQEPRMRIVSSVTGQFVSLPELRRAEYWRDQVRNAVEFQRAMETLAGAGYDTFLEIGPHPVLTGLGQQSIARDGQTWASSLHREHGAWHHLLGSLGTLFVRGTEVDWTAFDGGHNRTRVTLPSYPFQHQRYWFDTTAKPAQKRSTGHPLLGARTTVAGPTESHVWSTELSVESLPYLADHRVQGNVIVPATVYMEMAVAAAQDVFGDGPVALTNAQFRKPLVLGPGTTAHVQVTLASDGNVHVYGRLDHTAPWMLIATCTVERAELPAFDPPPADVTANRRAVAGDELYAALSNRGNQWGPTFRGVSHAWLGATEGWSDVVVPEGIANELHRYWMHPALGDASAHVLTAVTSGTWQPESDGTNGAANRAYVAHSFERVAIYARPRGKKLLSGAWVTQSDDPNTLRGDVRFFDEDGQLISEVRGVQMYALDQSANGSEIPPQEQWYHHIAWHDHPWTDTTDAGTNGPWTVVVSARPSSEQSAIAEALVEAMRGDGVEGRIISTNEISALAQAGAAKTSGGIVFLAGLDAAAPSGKSPSEELGAADVLELVRTLSTRGTGKLWIATRGVHPLESASSVSSVWQSPLWGLGRAVSVEEPAIWGGLADLDATDGAASNAAALWRHLRAPEGEDQVAFRTGRRVVARLDRLRQPDARSLPIRPDGAYLITGGLGGLGLEVARWLVEHGARRVILWGRSALPSRAEWKTLASDHPMYGAVERIRALEGSGASIHVGSVDVADVRSVAAFLETYANEAWPPIRGVVHAAGVVAASPLANTTPEAFDAILRPKLGAWVLHEALAQQPLDFFALFSSGSALRPPPGLGAYAAANTFLDALAQQRVSAGLPGLSINWGAWGDVGMAARDGVNELGDRGMGAMRTEQALDAFGRLLASPIAQAAVLPTNWTKTAQLFPAYVATPLFTDLLEVVPTTAQDTASSDESLLSGTPEERRARLIALFQRLLGGILGFAAGDVDTDASISTLGLDSLTAVEFRNRVAAAVGVSLPLVRLLQGPTLTELATDVEAQLEQSAPAAEMSPASKELISGEFPLSRGQRALWFLQQLFPNTSAYNLVFAGWLRPPLELETFRSALTALTTRHANLRAVIESTEAGLQYRVLPPSTPALEVVDCAGWSDDAIRAAAEERHHQQFTEGAPLIRTTLFRRGDEDFLIVVIHHVVLDAYSMQIVMGDLRELYEAALRGSAPDVPPLPVQYDDFVAAQTEMVEGPEGRALWDYWSTTLAHPLPVLDVQTSYPRPHVVPLEGSSTTFSVGHETAAALHAIAKEQHTTLFTVMMAAMQVWLHGLTGQRDVVVGSPGSLRTQDKWSGLVGYFVNPLPVRGTVNPNESFTAFVARTKPAVIGAIAHQEYPFPLLVEQLITGRDLSHSPIFQSMLNVHISPKMSGLSQLFNPLLKEPLPFGTSRLMPLPLLQQEGQFELSVEVLEAEGEVFGRMAYQTALYDAAAAARMSAAFVAVLDAIAENPAASVASLVEEDREEFEL